MNVLATVIASYGLLSNSPAVVIGAMIVAMLLNPILGISMAIAESDHQLVKTSLIGLSGGFTGVVVTALLIGLLHRDIPLTEEILSRTEPRFFDLMIALAGGAAGAYATVSTSLSSAFIGVAIATALVPPLSSSAILLARGELHLAFNAFLLAAANIVAIQLASSVVFWLVGFRGITHLSSTLRSFLVRDAPSIVAVLVLAGVFAVNLRTVVRRELFETAARGVIREGVAAWPGAHLVEVRFDASTPGLSIVRAVTRAPSVPSASDVAALEAKLPRSRDDRQVELRVRSVNTTVVTSYGVLFAPEGPTATP